LASIFGNQNMYDSAYFYSQKGNEIIKQLRTNTVAIESHQKYITTLLDAQEKDLLIAKQKNELKTSSLP